MNVNKLLAQLEKIAGGYVYQGNCSYQVCFPLKAGGELRFGLYDDVPRGGFAVDLYDGALPPGITGFVTKTGGKGGD